MKRRICTAFAAMCLLGTAGLPFASPEAESRMPGSIAGGITAWAEEVDPGMAENINAYVSQMTREDKVGQMLLVSPSQLCDGGDWTANMDTVLQNMKNYHVGGLVFFTEDLTDLDAVKTLIDKANEQGSIPVLTVADAGGSLETGFTKPDESTSMHIGPYAIGTEGIWCYSTQQTPSEEMQNAGILLDVTPGFSPETGADFVVVTHAKVNYASVADVNGLELLEMDDGRPASMSRILVTEQLKNGESGFEGTVFTDSLSMLEAVQTYGSDMAVMYALQAGADILTAPSNVLNAYYGIHSAIDEQLVTEEQIDGSMIRILELKAKLGLQF